MSTHAHEQLPALAASDKVERISNVQLLRGSRNCRFFFASYLVTQIGYSLNLIASLSLLASLDVDPESSPEETKMVPIASLLFLRLLPPLVVTPLIGGPIADKYSKKTIIIICDVISSVVVFLFPLAAYFQSPALVYIAALSLSFVDSMYMPSKSAIVPFIVNHEPEKVKTAAALLAVLWSATNAIGSAVGGEITAEVGYLACFYINVGTFLASAILMSFVGELAVPPKKKESLDDDDNENESLIKGDSKSSKTGGADSSESEASPLSTMDATLDTKSDAKTLMQYLKSKRSIPILFVFIQGLGALIWGPGDILTFVFSKNDPRALGIIYGSIGFGCLLGTLTLDWVDKIIPAPKLKNESQTSHDFVGCLIGILLMSAGLLGMSFDSGRGDNFDLAMVVFWMTIKSVGSAYLWVFSALLVQILTDPHYLGRVYAIENSASMFAEGGSSFASALVIDYLGVGGYDLCRWVGLMGLVFVALPMYQFWCAHYQVVGKDVPVTVDVEKGERTEEREGLVDLEMRDRNSNTGDGIEVEEIEKIEMAKAKNKDSSMSGKNIRVGKRRGISIEHSKANMV